MGKSAYSRTASYQVELMAYSVAVTRFRLEKAFFAVADFSTIQRHSSPAS